MKQPLVSIIIPTKNSGSVITACLESLKKQTYQNLEVLVVDNHSSDNTREIADQFTDHVFVKGPERSTQRNYGVKKSKGQFVLIIDSDMVLSSRVVESCVKQVQSQPEVKGVIIPESSFGQGFWAECKRLEKSLYVGVEYMEAARFFDKKLFLALGGYNEELISGEDWDLSQRVKKQAKLSRIKSFIYHNEGNLSLIQTIKKKYFYASHFYKYIEKHKMTAVMSPQTNIVHRYMLFFKRPDKWLREPIVFLGLLFMKTAEFSVGALGVMHGKLRL